MSATEIIRKSPSHGDASKLASKTMGEKVHIQTSADVFAHPALPEIKRDNAATLVENPKVGKHLKTLNTNLSESKKGKEGRDEQGFERSQSVKDSPEETQIGKRKITPLNENNNKKFYRKRRKTTDQTRTVSKFLLGGNINDPLNLNSLADEEVSKAVNAQSPISSPLPERNKDPDPIIVPQDLRDPLKLNSDTDESPSLTKVIRKRKRRNSFRGSKVEESSFEEDKDPSKPAEGPLPKDLLTIDVRSHQVKPTAVDKIVSPVIPEACRKRKHKRKSDPSSVVSKALLINSNERKQPFRPHPKDKKHGHHQVKGPERSRSTDDHPLPKFREKEQQYRFGNYVGYYGYRNTEEEDVRLTYFRRHWFEGKTCLDIGCNSGHVTLYVAKTFQPQKIVGMDIDAKLIGLARKGMRHHLEEALKAKGGASGVKFPVSMKSCFGALPVSTEVSQNPAAESRRKTQSPFPQNVLFRCGNFVLSRDDLLHTQKEEYDTILCLSVTKWIHLNWGDDGLKRFFRRIYLALRVGGLLVLEPQAWPSYTKKKKMTETTYRNYNQIRFRPNDFKGFLLQDVGFSSCEVIGTPRNQSKGFRRPLLLFKKLTRRPLSEILSTAGEEESPGCSARSSKGDDSASQFSGQSGNAGRDTRGGEDLTRGKHGKEGSKVNLAADRPRGHAPTGKEDEGGETPAKIQKKE